MAKKKSKEKLTKETSQPDVGYDGTSVTEISIMQNVNYSKEIIDGVRGAYNLKKLISLRKDRKKYLDEAKEQIYRTWHGTISLKVHHELFTTLFLIAMGTILIEVEEQFQSKSAFVKWRSKNFDGRQTRYFQQAVQLAKMGDFAKRYAAMGKRRLLQIEHIRKEENIKDPEQLLALHPPDKDISDSVIDIEVVKKNPFPDVSFDYDLDGDLIKHYIDSITTLYRLKHAGIEFADMQHAKLIADYQRQALPVGEAAEIKSWLDSYPKAERKGIFDDFIMDRLHKPSGHVFEPTGSRYSLNHLLAKMVDFFKKADLNDKDWIENQRQILDTESILEVQGYLQKFIRKADVKSREKTVNKKGKRK